MAKTILILGGYGLAGVEITRLLLERTPASLILAGRSLDKAKTAAAEFARKFPGRKINVLAVDASDEAAMTAALRDVDLLIVASSTAKYTRVVVRAAIKAHCDYVDIIYSPTKVKILRQLGTTINRSGQVFITDGGFHPGVPAALVRYAAVKNPAIEKSRVACVLDMNWSRYAAGESAREEFVEGLFSASMEVYRKRRWRKVHSWQMRHFPRIDFGEPVGKRWVAPMTLDEMKSLAEELPGLRETGFYVAGFHWFTDVVLFPICMLAYKLAPGLNRGWVSQLMLWGLGRISPEEERITIQLEAWEAGCKEPSVYMRLSHSDGYVLTAIPTVACVLQYLNGMIKPGLEFMALAVDPVQYVTDMVSMGIWKEAWES